MNTFSLNNSFRDVRVRRSHANSFKFSSPAFHYPTVDYPTYVRYAKQYFNDTC